jgi:hypothetical protein
MERNLMPAADQHAALADILALQNPEWPRTRCMLRAAVEWQKPGGPALLEASQKRMRA